MVEEAEGAGFGAEAAGPAAITVALGGASREQADSFLKDQQALIADQRKLVQLQAKELAHELKLRHWSLWVRHASGVLKLTLRGCAGADRHWHRLFNWRCDLECGPCRWADHRAFQPTP